MSTVQKHRRYRRSIRLSLSDPSRTANTWLGVDLRVYNDIKVLPRGSAPRIILQQLFKEHFKYHQSPAAPTIKDIYGTDIPAIPDLYEPIAFRPVVPGKDTWLVSPLHEYEGGPRIVLRKKDSVALPPSLVHESEKKKGEPMTQNDLCTVCVTDIYGEGYTIPAGWKIVGFRIPKEENYLGLNQSAGQVLHGTAWGPRLILKPNKRVFLVEETTPGKSDGYIQIDGFGSKAVTIRFIREVKPGETV